MERSPDSAQEALNAIERMARQGRVIRNLAGAAPILLIWGTVWLLGYLSTAWFLAKGQIEPIGLAWWILSGIGGVLTAFFSYRFPMRLEGQWRLGVLWFAIIGFGAFWLFLFHPWNGAQMNLFMATLIMLAWVVIGLILNNLFWTLSGVAFAVLIVASYFVLGFSVALWAWLGLSAGGGMILLGLYVLLRTRRHG